MTAGLLLPALALLLIGASVSGPGSQPGAGGADTGQRIRFDLSALNDDGLYGPPDGLRALNYEFCIPATETHAAEVGAIDASLQIMRRSPGRIGCTAEQYLCIGSTYQPGFRAVLERLADLPYIDRIEPSFAE